MFTKERAIFITHVQVINLLILWHVWELETLWNVCESGNQHSAGSLIALEFWATKFSLWLIFQFFSHMRVICKVTLCFTPISLAFPPYPLYQWYPQSKEILLNVGMKLCNSAFNAQGSRVIIVVVQVGVVKIYVATVKALRKKERQDKTQFTTKFGGKISLGPSYFFL